MILCGRFKDDEHHHEVIWLQPEVVATTQVRGCLVRVTGDTSSAISLNTGANYPANIRPSVRVRIREGFRLLEELYFRTHWCVDAEVLQLLPLR